MLDKKLTDNVKIDKAVYAAAGFVAGLMIGTSVAVILMINAFEAWIKTLS